MVVHGGIMATFAELNRSNIVQRVVVIDNEDCLDENGNESEEVGAAFLTNLLGGKWKQTSYNATIRKNYAGVGFKYDSKKDAFIPPQPFASWVLNDDCKWDAPVAYPNDGNRYSWDEESISWILIPAPEEE